MNFFCPENANLHSELDQLKRQKSALKLTMDFINSQNKTGRIKDYDVSLASCTCIDFARRTKPCKHMYCLAKALGIFEFSSEQTIESRVMHLKKFASEHVPYVYYSYEKLRKSSSKLRCH